MHLILTETPKGLMAEAVTASIGTPPYIDKSKYHLTYFPKEIKAILEVSSLKPDWTLFQNLTKALIVSHRLTNDEFINEFYIRKQVKHWDSLAKGTVDETDLVNFIEVLKEFLESDTWKNFLKDNLAFYKISSYRFAIFGIKNSLSMGLINFSTPLSLVNRLTGGLQYHQVDRSINLNLKKILETFSSGVPSSDKRPVRHIQSELYPFSQELLMNITSKDSVKGYFGGISPQDAYRRPRSYFIFETVNAYNHLHISW